MHSKVRIKHTHTRTRIYFSELIYHTLPLTAFYLGGVKLHPGELTRFRHNSFPQQIRSLREGNRAQRWTLLSRLLRNSVHTTRVCMFVNVSVCVCVCVQVCDTQHQALPKPEPQRQSSKTGTNSPSREFSFWLYLSLPLNIINLSSLITPEESILLLSNIANVKQAVHLPWSLLA